MLAVHWGLRGGCWREHLLWSLRMVIVLPHSNLRGPGGSCNPFYDLPRNSCKITIVTVSPRFKGRKDRPHLSLEGYLLHTERWASGVGYLLWLFLESIISHTFQYLQSIPELKTLPWFLTTHMIKFSILRKPHRIWFQPLSDFALWAPATPASLLFFIT